jgi:hypothetical protein
MISRRQDATGGTFPVTVCSVDAPPRSQSDRASQGQELHDTGGGDGGMDRAGAECEEADWSPSTEVKNLVRARKVLVCLQYTHRSILESTDTKDILVLSDLALLITGRRGAAVAEFGGRCHRLGQCFGGTRFHVLGRSANTPRCGSLARATESGVVIGGPQCVFYGNVFSTNRRTTHPVCAGVVYHIVF